MKMKFEDGKLVEDDSAKEKSDKADEKNSKATLSDEDKELVTDMINDMLQDEDIMTSLDVDSSGDLDEDEVNKFLEFATNEKTGKMSLNSLSESANSIHETSALLDDIYSNSDYGKFLDEDNDGKIGDEEKDKFEKYLKGDKDILEVEDVERAKDLMDKDAFSYDIPNDSVADEDYEESIANNTATKSSPASSSSYGGYTTGNPGSASSTYTAPSSSVSSLEETETLEQLQQQKTDKQKELDTAQGELDKATGLVDTKQQEADTLKEAYETALNEDTQVDKQLKEDFKIADEKYQQQDKLVSDTEKSILTTSQEKTTLETQYNADNSNLEALKSALSSLPDPSQYEDNADKQAEINSKKSELKSKISELEPKVQDEKTQLEEKEKELNTLEQETLPEQKRQLDEFKAQRDELEQQILETCSEETKQALEAYDAKKEEVEAAKANVETEKGKTDEIQAQMNELDKKINEKQAEQTQKDYKVGESFDYDFSLTDSQKQNLDQFAAHWEQNKERYEALAEKSGFPAELIASIHWREGSGNFNTYLHNGQTLGQTTTIVPKGIYFDNWEDAALDALSNHGGGLSAIDKNDTNSWLDYAEHYNGMGYRNKGVASPYVWAGTQNYSGGMYVKDGVYSASAYDNRVGVAAMLKAIME